MSEPATYEDRDPPESEIIRLKALFANGEISEQNFAWLMGYIDIAEDKPFHLMSKAEKRRYFANQKANNLGGMDLFGNTKKFRKARKSRRAKRFIIPVAEIGGTVEAMNE